MRDWGLADAFEYRGTLSREEKVRFLQQLSVLSVPCPQDEPKGLPILEAMASGVPVVQPRRGSFPEILRRVPGGLLVDPDSVRALADGILSLALDPEHAAALGRQGVIGVREHYGIARMADRTLALYETLAAGSAARSGAA
jgi:glycosyltransferase involved in cell wall biosynthesis